MIDKKECPIVKELKRMIKKLRKESDMPQFMLAEESHISLPQIKRYETGISFPTFCGLVRIIKATEHDPVNEVAKLVNICKNCTKTDICLTYSHDAD